MIISVHIPGNAAKFKGVIYDVPLTMEEIIQEVKGGKVMKATWLQIKRNGVKNYSLSVLLEFENVMPKKIRMGYLSYDIREFSPAPMSVLIAKEWGTLQDNEKES